MTLSIRNFGNFFRANDQAAIEAGQPRVNEEWLQFAADDHRALFETIKTPMRDAGGRLVGVLHRPQHHGDEGDDR